MNNERELNNDILKITLLIQDKFPELSKYIGEMPVTIPDTSSPEINFKNLKDYRDSLNQLFKKYNAGHTSKPISSGKAGIIN